MPSFPTRENGIKVYFLVLTIKRMSGKERMEYIPWCSPWEGFSGSSEEDVTGNNWEHSPHRQKPPPVKFYREIERDNPHLQQCHQLSEKWRERRFQWLRAQNVMSTMKWFRSHSGGNHFHHPICNMAHHAAVSSSIHARFGRDLVWSSENSNGKEPNIFIFLLPLFAWIFQIKATLGFKSYVTLVKRAHFCCNIGDNNACPACPCWLRWGSNHHRWESALETVCNTGTQGAVFSIMSTCTNAQECQRRKWRHSSFWELFCLLPQHTLQG